MAPCHSLVIAIACLCAHLSCGDASADAPSPVCAADGAVQSNQLLQHSQAAKRRTVLVEDQSRPCTDTLTSQCCGDGVCDGPETPTNCAADCDGGSAPAPPPPSPPSGGGGSTPAPPPPSPPSGGGGARSCTDSLTSKCCGDGICDGPETADNCNMDCSGSGDGEEPGEPGTPAPAPAPGPGGSGDGACTTVPAEKPTVPTLCTAENKGCCECGEINIKTFVFWTDDGSSQRCFHTWNYPSSAPSGGPMPVVLHMDGYSGGKKGSEMGGKMGDAATYYGFVTFTLGSLLKDGAGGFGLEFGNKGIANDDNPTPCDKSDSRDIEYLEKIFQFIGDNPTLFDAAKVFTEGFSQNSMFAAYAAVCFKDKVAGIWQGGSGQARTGSNPVAPGFQGQCSFDSYTSHGDDCCNQDFCDECQYWPLWPKTCSHKVVDCIASYTDDTIACGSDWQMYEAMVQEGNDARLLSFPIPTGDTFAGHRDPKNKWAWFAGCLGIVPACSATCEASFDACVDGAADDKAYDKFATCEGQLKAGALGGCTVGCAPTLGMLRRSEEPVVTLSKGNFGTDQTLPAATGSAPQPNCKAGFGPFSTGPGPKPKCTPPSSYAAPAISPKDTC
mmetsp:Transcript_104999/g.327476  ORF Transcript_104999/g.327476 Transcript_104999/m.327476 type:complete len:612 (-) Transcript_104999:225-2060(-)